MLVSTAYAQASTATPMPLPASSPQDMVLQFAPLLMIFAVFYFLLIRPQQKQLRQHQERMKSLKVGDKILTDGGIIGTITRLKDENEVSVEIAEGVKVVVVRAMIKSVYQTPEKKSVSAAQTLAPAKKIKKSKVSVSQKPTIDNETGIAETASEPQDIVVSFKK